MACLSGTGSQSPAPHDSGSGHRGVWIFRGQEIPPIMQEECVDLELYTWKKVDLSDAVRPSACITSGLPVLVGCRTQVFSPG